MTEWLGQSALAAGDLLFGWLLHWPSDAALVLLALASAVMLVAVRKLTTDQDLLRRCVADRKRIRALLREAKVKSDHDAVARLRGVRSRIALKQLRAEMLPLACLILPVAFLANWAWHRLEFHAPRPGESVEVRVGLPAAAVGDLVHLVPLEQWDAPGGWIQPVERTVNGSAIQGVARWRLIVGPNTGTMSLLVRHRQRTFAWDWRFDRRRVDPLTRQFNDGAARIELRLQPVKLFGVVPGLRWLGLPPWLVGYLLLTALFVALLKKGWRVS